MPTKKLVYKTNIDPVVNTYSKLSKSSQFVFNFLIKTYRQFVSGFYSLPFPVFVSQTTLNQSATESSILNETFQGIALTKIVKKSLNSQITIIDQIKKLTTMLWKFVVISTNQTKKFVRLLWGFRIIAKEQIKTVIITALAFVVLAVSYIKKLIALFQHFKTMLIAQSKKLITLFLSGNLVVIGELITKTSVLMGSFLLVVVNKINKNVVSIISTNTYITFLNFMIPILKQLINFSTTTQTLIVKLANVSRLDNLVIIAKSTKGQLYRFAAKFVLTVQGFFAYFISQIQEVIGILQPYTTPIVTQFNAINTMTGKWISASSIKGALSNAASTVVSQLNKFASITGKWKP